MKIHIEIKPELKRIIDELREEKGYSLNWIVVRAITNFLKLKRKI